MTQTQTETIKKGSIKIISKNPLVRKIIDGSAPADLMEMLLEKHLPLTDEEYLEALYFASLNSEYEGGALAQLKNLGNSSRQTYVERPEANHQVAFFILDGALAGGHYDVVARVIRNQALPYTFLREIAKRGDLHMLETLMENQTKLIAFPEIMDTMEENPAANQFIMGKIKETRDFYLGDKAAEPIPEDAVTEDVKELLAQEEEEARKSAESEGTDETGAEADSGEEGEEDIGEAVEEKAQNVLQQINAMNISERIKLAITGGKTHRMILIKDSNKMVSLAVVESPKLTLDEVVLMAKNRSLPGEIISKIANNREFSKNYPVVLELINNPKTPIKKSIEFIKKLHLRDLKSLSHNKNISPVVRQVAIKFMSQRDR